MTEETPLPKLAERCWRALDTLHVPVYFAPEPSEGYAELGIRPRAGYFVSRSAAMGAVSPDVTVATFYVFAPGLVHHVMAGCWDKASPAQVLAARHATAIERLRTALDEPDPTVVPRLDGEVQDIDGLLVLLKHLAAPSVPGSG